MQVTKTNTVFNLWTQPWITLVSIDGSTSRMSIFEAISHAHSYMSIHEMSPLVVVGIHRLLTAILQFAFNPQKPADIQKIWASGKFPKEVIENFGSQYADRFDLFSEDKPFLQSADIPLKPGNDTKTAAYLYNELPTGTEITHYKHGNQQDHLFCPVCMACGLVTIAPFAIVGGAGIKPSINGVPPVYIIPGGDSLFYSLAASLVLPEYKPTSALKDPGDVWWLRASPIIEESKEVHGVSYLHSLTFPARRVRLFPSLANSACTRCGQHTEWGVREVIYQMGEFRPKDDPFWQDPFAAYRTPQEKPPTPIRPLEGKSIWREFAALFLRVKDVYKRPSVLEQMAEIGLDADRDIYPFRCIGLRTDMKAKVFEWIDVNFQVPTALLDDPESGILIQDAMNYAQDCVYVIKRVFDKYFVKKGKKREQNRTLKKRMEEQYWSSLAQPFQKFIAGVAHSEGKNEALNEWANLVVDSGRNVFFKAIELVGSEAVYLRLRVEAEQECEISLLKTRKDYLT